MLRRLREKVERRAARLSFAPPGTRIHATHQGFVATASVLVKNPTTATLKAA